MQGNNQPNQQQEKDGHDLEQNAPDAGRIDAADAAKQAPGHNETPDQRNEDDDGEVNERDAAWRPGEPSDQTVHRGSTNENGGEPFQNSQANPESAVDFDNSA